MTEPLDPDQVACPTCDAQPGKPCLRPDGLTRASAIHIARRRATTAPAVVKASPRRRPSPATPAGRAKGAKAGGETTAAKRKRDAATVRGIIGEVRATALLERAAEIGANAARWDADRMTLRRIVLDDALHAAALLGEQIEAARRVVLGPDGRPVMVPREVTRDGRRVVEDTPDARGYVESADLKATGDLVAKLVGTVRLEEGLDGKRGEADLSGLSDAEIRAALEAADRAAGELGP